MKNRQTLQLIINKLQHIRPFKRIGLVEYGALQELIKTTQDLLHIVEQYQSKPCASENRQQGYGSWDEFYDDSNARTLRRLYESNRLLDKSPVQETFVRASKEYCDAASARLAAHFLLEAERSKQKTEELLQEAAELRRNRR